MSRENVEIVRRAFLAALRKPEPDFETVNALFDPDHELVSLISAVEGRSFVGARGFREWLADIDATWDSWDAEMGEIQDVGGERVLAAFTFLGHSRGAGVALERPSWFVSTVRDGKLVRTESYESESQALEAAGMVR